ncbi:amino acid permease, partial [Bacillus mycoides]|nr:amino acid permease [Bacillus mycoides]
FFTITENSNDIFFCHRLFSITGKLFNPFPCALLVDLNLLANLVNMGTITAFVFVSIAVIVLRKTHPDMKRPFRAPLVPFL